jgi:hypothetical protein
MNRIVCLTAAGPFLAVCPLQAAYFYGLDVDNDDIYVMDTVAGTASVWINFNAVPTQTPANSVQDRNTLAYDAARNRWVFSDADNLANGGNLARLMTVGTNYAPTAGTAATNLLVSNLRSAGGYTVAQWPTNYILNSGGATIDTNNSRLYIRADVGPGASPFIHYATLTAAGLTNYGSYTVTNAPAGPSGSAAYALGDMGDMQVITSNQLYAISRYRNTGSGTGTDLRLYSLSITGTTNMAYRLITNYGDLGFSQITADTDGNLWLSVTQTNSAGTATGTTFRQINPANGAFVSSFSVTSLTFTDLSPGPRIPEPSTALALLAGAAGFLSRRRR